MSESEYVRRQRCGTCKWWNGEDTNLGPPSYDRKNTGACRRYPPRQIAPDVFLQSRGQLQQVRGKHQVFEKLAEDLDGFIYTVSDMDCDVETGCYRWTTARDWCGEWAQTDDLDGWEEVPIIDTPTPVIG
jgi:hypothetical protein